MASKAQKRAQKVNWAIYCIRGMIALTAHYIQPIVKDGNLQVELTRTLRKLQEANHD